MDEWLVDHVKEFLLIISVGRGSGIQECEKSENGRGWGGKEQLGCEDKIVCATPFHSTH
jgi:hypothetical protein